MGFRTQREAEALVQRPAKEARFQGLEAGIFVEDFADALFLAVFRDDEGNGVAGLVPVDELEEEFGARFFFDLQPFLGEVLEPVR